VRLAASLGRLERGKKRRPLRVAIWSEDELKLGRPLAEGEFLAVDLCVVVPPVDPDAPEPERAPRAVTMQSRERATRDPEDLGDVYDGSALLVGKVYDVLPGRVPFLYWADLDWIEEHKRDVAAGVVSSRFLSHG
jgi:hypothetical protein